MPGRRTLAAALGLLALLSTEARPQGAVAFQPGIGVIPDGVTMGVTPVVSHDRRYVRLGVGATFQTVAGFQVFPVPGAVAGGGVTGGVGLPGVGGFGVGGGGGGAGGVGMAAAGPGFGFSGMNGPVDSTAMADAGGFGPGLPLSAGSAAAGFPGPGRASTDGFALAREADRVAGALPPEPTPRSRPAAGRRRVDPKSAARLQAARKRKGR